MPRMLRISASITFAATAALTGQLVAQLDFRPALRIHADKFHAQPIAGADIITGGLAGVHNWGGVGGTAAYSLNAVRCNVGDVELSEVQSTDQHHVGGQQIYRVNTVDGATRIEQLGMSWCMHGFCAMQQTYCGSCTPACCGCASAIGVGCSDVYTAARCGTQGNNGPRYDINVSTGHFTYPLSYIGATTGIGLLGKRLQVDNVDLNPALQPAAQYFEECVTVQPQDALAGNAANNAAYRKLIIGALTGTPPNQFYQISETGPSFPQLPAIHAWQSVDPTVTILNIDVPGDGRFVVGYDVSDLGDGNWHYEYAIYNISSHRSGQSFSIPVPDGVKLSSIEFRDIDYHTQQILPAWAQVDNVDWTIDSSSGAVTWSTSAYSGPAPDGNEHTANALRWGTLYNFRFDADVPPQLAQATLALFRPGAPDSVGIELLGPGLPAPCPADLNDDGQVGGIDLAMLLGAWGNCPLDGPCPCPADLNCDSWIDGLDLATLLAAWGEC